MEKPCTTDEFIKALVGSRRAEVNYDFYDIQEAVIDWEDGNYVDALKRVRSDYLEKILDDSWIIEHDYSGKVLTLGISSQVAWF